MSMRHNFLIFNMECCIGLKGLLLLELGASLFLFPFEDETTSADGVSLDTRLTLYKVVFSGARTLLAFFILYRIYTSEDPDTFIYS